MKGPKKLKVPKGPTVRTTTRVTKSGMSTTVTTRNQGRITSRTNGPRGESYRNTSVGENNSVSILSRGPRRPSSNKKSSGSILGRMIKALFGG